MISLINSQLTENMEYQEFYIEHKSKVYCT